MHIEFPTGPLARGKHTSGVFSMVEVKNMSYRQQRDYENLNKAIFDGVGEYDIPVIEPDSPQVDNWISFNYAKGCEEPEIHGIHFFIDDYQFVRVWK